jgi:argininosuccinate synthase
MAKRLLLAFSGGLDTSYCVLHLRRDHGYEVHTITFDCGGVDADEQAKIEARSVECGASSHRFVDLRPEMCGTILAPLIRSGFLKGENYPLCVGSERGLQAAHLAKEAIAHGFDAVGHGCTRAGNDQVRFDVTLRAILPESIAIEAPIRDLGPERSELAAQLREAGITVDDRKTLYSINTSLWGTTLGGGPLHDPAQPVPDDVREKVLRPSEVTNPDQDVTISFTGGVPTAVNGEAGPLHALIERLNGIGAAHALGRDVHTGDTVLGIKGRIVFEAPAAFLIHQAHRELSKVVLTKTQLHLRNHLLPMYGQMLHEGFWLDPVMADVDAYFASEQRAADGDVTLRLGKGTSEISRIDTPKSRMRGRARYGERSSGWDGRDAAGFSKILGIYLTQGTRQ